MEDKRLTKRLVDYWDRLRKDAILPPWEHFNVGGLADIWGQCCVWRVDITGEINNAPRYTYEYVGASAQEALGKDLTGLVFASHLQKFPGARVAERIHEAMKTVAPIIDEGSFVNDKGRIVKYRSCLLPFGTKEGKVKRIVLGMSWKTF